MLSRVVLTTVVFAFLTSTSTGVAQSVYCVTADPAAEQGTVREVRRSAEPKCNETKTWNQYIARQDRYFNAVSNSTFLFLPGTHYMNDSLKSNNAKNLCLASDSVNAILTNDVGGLSTTLSFSNFTNITVEGLSITVCAYDEQADHSGLLHFSNGTYVTVRNAVVDNTCNGSEIYAEEVANMSIVQINVTETNENFCGSLCLYQKMTGTINIEHSTFQFFNTSSRKSQFINFGPGLVSNASILIHNCSFIRGEILTTNLASTAYINMTSVFANGHGHNSQPGISVVGENGLLYISKSEFTRFRSAITVHNVSIQIYDSVFHHNQAVDIESQAYKASALSVKYSKTTVKNILSNVNFTWNGYTDDLTIITNAATLLVYSSELSIENCNFLANVGHPLYLYHSKLLCAGNVRFTSNVGYAGSAMYIYDTDVQYSDCNITFESNAALYTGGAIQIAGQHTFCPFTHEPDGLNPGNLIFNENIALYGGGDAIYGGHLDQATVGNTSLRCIELIRKSSVFRNSDDSFALISSEPSRVCLCNTGDNDSKSIRNCLQVFSSREAFPGEDVIVSVVAVGQTFGTSAGFVNAQLLQTTSGFIPQQQQYQPVGQRYCNDLTYTISAQPGEISILVLTTKNGLIQEYGNTEEVDAAIKEYNQNNHSYVPEKLLNFPIYINFTLKSCPLGFFSAGGYVCQCFSRLQDIDGVECHISNRQLERSGRVWIGSDDSDHNDNTSIVLFTKYCPYNYCNSSKVNIFNSSNLQCLSNHIGKLCGRCPDGMSLTLGESHCRHCTNTHLYLLIPFAISGVVLVVFIKVTDVTTAGGLINGLIFYANLVKASSYAYFTTSTNTGLISFLQIFIDWVNLDLGIETCFFDGLNGYWKTWLQFVFPLYIWAIALSMILLARYSIRMARLLGNNSVPVLATLFVLSYAKLFRTIITAIKFTTLEDQNGTKTHVWSYDGSVDYLAPNHSILFIVTLIVLFFLWLPYTCVLFSVQWLQKCRVKMVSRSIARMHPLLDAHCGPFKDKHRYWFGTLLVARAIPLLIGVSIPTNSYKNTLMSTVIVVGVLAYFQSRVYRKVYVSLSEAVFLVNLLFLATSALYTSSIDQVDKQKYFTGVLVGMAFIHFAVIVVFSTIRHCYQVCGRHYRELPLLASSRVSVNESDSNNLSYQQYRSDIK